MNVDFVDGNDRPLSPYPYKDVPSVYVIVCVFVKHVHLASEYQAASPGRYDPPNTL